MGVATGVGVGVGAGVSARRQPCARKTPSTTTRAKRVFIGVDLSVSRKSNPTFRAVESVRAPALPARGRALADQLRESARRPKPWPPRAQLESPDAPAARRLPLPSSSPCPPRRPTSRSRSRTPASRPPAPRPCLRAGPSTAPARRGRRATRGGRPGRSGLDGAGRGHAGLADRPLRAGDPAGRPRLPTVGVGEDDEGRGRPAGALPHARWPPPSRWPPSRSPTTRPPSAARADWTRVETTFVATAASDRVELQLGRNGTATGRAWFDDVALAEVGDITEVIPLERVRWEGPAFRYEDRGLDLRPRGGRALRSRPPVREAGVRGDRRLHPEARRSGATRRTRPTAGAGCAPWPTRSCCGASTPSSSRR